MGRYGSGLAADRDIGYAAEQATRRALAPLGGTPPDLLCAFVCGGDTDEVETAFARITDLARPHSSLGCSAGGVLGGDQGVEAATAVSVWAMQSPGVRVRTFHLEVMRTPDSLAIVGMPPVPPDTGVCLLLADPYSFPADGFVERLNDSAAGLPVAGGLATGPAGAGSTRLLLDGRVVSRGAIGALVEGAVSARTVVSQGCRPVGPTLTVTAADGNVLLELAGLPAVTKLEQLLESLPPEDQALASRGLHIGVAMNEYGDHHERGDFLIRGVLGADRDRGGLVVGDLIEVGRTVRFQVRDATTADEDLTSTLAGFGPVEGALLFSCNGRGATLFPSADHDIVTVRSLLAQAPVAGFFAAGEIGPVGGRNYLHGFTASIVAFGAGP